MKPEVGHAAMKVQPRVQGRSCQACQGNAGSQWHRPPVTWVWRDLLAEGVECGLHRIERLMRLQALRARPRRRRLPKDQGDRQMPIVPSNILDRQFEAERPNQKWIADFTYIWTAEGWLYVSAVIDLFSRRVVGWSMSATMTAQLVADALLMAVWRRGKPRELVHHSDQGSQYSGEQFERLMADSGIARSDEPVRQCLGQRRDGKLLLVAEDRAHRAPGTRQGRMCSTISSGSTTAHQNTHLAMCLKRRGFAGRDAILRGILDSAGRVP